MRLVHRWLPVLLLAATFALLVPDESSTNSRASDEPTQGEDARPGLADWQRLELSALDAEVRAKAALVYEASERVRVEQLRLEETRRQQQRAVQSQRLVQMQEARLAEAEGWQEIKSNEYEEARLRRDQFRRRVRQSGNEPEDIEAFRQLLKEEITLAEGQLRTREAQLEAAELLVQSETAGYRNYQRMVSAGQEPAITLELAGFRLTEARVWRMIRESERDLAQTRFEQARARLEQLEADPKPGPRTLDEAELDPEALLLRLQALEREVQSLRDESAILKRWIQM